MCASVRARCVCAQSNAVYVSFRSVRVERVHAVLFIY